MGVYGQDWASYQGSYPPATGLAFVFIKVTEALSYTNPYWQSQKADALRAGAAVGFYHYPNMHDSVPAEADFFASKATIQPGEMIVLDWEGYDTANAGVDNAHKLAYKEQYLTYMKQKFPNNPVGLYCNVDYWLNVDTTGHCGDFLWIATAGKPAGQPGIKAPWVFHQYSANPVDKDYANFASIAALKTWISSFNKNAPTPPPTEDDLPYTEAQLTTIFKNAVTSPEVRDALAYADLFWLSDVFAMKPITSPNAAMQNIVNSLQTELAGVLGKIDPAVLTELETAISTAIKNTAITATVEVNGTVK